MLQDNLGRLGRVVPTLVSVRSGVVA